jgi:NAD(P)-dependent dehydrogenase (short-subunit alcohol dehydrogenase family)
MKQFKDRVAVITGAASGFGREFAHAGAKLGMKLVLADVQQDALATLEAELSGQGVAVLAVHCDVSKPEQVQALADATMARFAAVHLLFNNAGVGAGGLIWENSASDWDWVLGVNLFGVIHGVRIFTPLMLACAQDDPDYEGHIVNTASVAGLQNAPTMGIYNVSKHAVVSVTEIDRSAHRHVLAVPILCAYRYSSVGTQSSGSNAERSSTDYQPACGTGVLGKSSSVRENFSCTGRTADV